MNGKLQEVIDFFELEEGYDKNEIISDIIHEMKQLKGYAPDEIELRWEDEDVGILSDFTLLFYDKVIEKVCNVIRSSK